MVLASSACSRHRGPDEVGAETEREDGKEGKGGKEIVPTDCSNATLRRGRAPSCAAGRVKKGTENTADPIPRTRPGSKNDDSRKWGNRWEDKEAQREGEAA